MISDISYTTRECTLIKLAVPCVPLKTIIRGALKCLQNDLRYPTTPPPKFEHYLFAL